MRFIRRNLGVLLGLTTFLLIVGFGSYELLQRQPAPPSTRSGTLAFSTNRDGNPEIYTWTVTERKATRMTNNPQQDGHPDFSPNNRLLAYSAWTDGEADIIIADAVNGAGGPIATLAGSETEPDWYPDSASLVYVSDVGETPSLYWIERETRIVRRLTGDEGADSSPSWSPDGKRIVFASNRGGTNDIYMLDVASCQPPVEGSPENTPETCAITPLVADDAQNTQPAWSPTRDAIVFVSNREGESALYTVNTRGRRLNRLTEGAQNSDPAWSPEGGRVSFTTVLPSGETAVQVLDINRREIEAITNAGETASQSAWRPEETS
jgi:Tol biopolymer transport system component